MGEAAGIRIMKNIENTNHLDDSLPVKKIDFYSVAEALVRAALLPEHLACDPAIEAIENVMKPSRDGKKTAACTPDAIRVRIGGGPFCGDFCLCNQPVEIRSARAQLL